MSESDIDNELVTLTLRGDKEAFDILVLKYQDVIFRVVMGVIHDQSAAKDVTQEAFIASYRALSSFKGDSSFYTWLYRIAVNGAKNHLKSKTRRPPDSDLDITDISISDRVDLGDCCSPESILCSDELEDAVVSAVNHLPDDLRSCIVLREIAGLSYEEIADVMKCPVGTVRSRIFRARMAVDEKIKLMINP